MMRKLLYSFLFFIYTKSLPQRLFIPNLRLLCVGMFFVVSFANAATIISTASGGNWNLPSTWSGGVVPLPTDIVVIASGANVFTSGNQTCAGITITGRLTMVNNETLTVNGNVAGGGNWTTGSGSMIISLTGNWSFTGTSSGGGATAVFTGTNNQTLTGRITSSNGSGELRINKTGGSVVLGNAINIQTFTNNLGTFDAATYLLTAGVNNLIAGTLRVGATTWGGNYSFTPASFPSGFTIEYDRSNDQTVRAATYSNLILSGGGTKTFGTTPINITNNLSITWGVVANLSNNVTHTAGSLTLGGHSQNSGYWGGRNGNSVNYKSEYYFGTTATGRVNVGASCNEVAVATISASSTLICKGAGVTFTATASNQVSPSYQWKVNGVNAGTNSVTFTSTTLNDNDKVTCVVTSGAAPCLPSGSTVTSNEITMSVSTITASASPTTIASGGTTNLTSSATPASYTATLLNQDFNSTNPGWAVSGNTGSVAWTLKPDGYFYEYTSTGNYEPFTFRSNDNTQFYLSNSATQDANIITYLTSPVIPITGYTGLSLEFYHYYYSWSGDSAVIEVSTNGGTSWTSVQTFNTTQGTENKFEKVTIPLNTFANGTNTGITVRFKYTASFDWFWAIDNVKVTGTKPVTYTYNWTATPSGTTAGLSATNVANPTATPTQTTSYFATATNSANSCTVSSSPVVVTVTPVINSFSPTSACPGTNVVITGSAFNGATAVTFNGVSSTFTVDSNTQITATVPSTATTGTISITTPSGSVTSTATLTVNTSPSIGTQPSASAICSGSNTTFGVVASGTGLIYKWQFSTNGTNFNDLANGGVYSNVGTATMTITGATAGMNNYQYRVVINGTCGSVTSNAATLTLNTGPSISAQPSGTAICAGSDTTFGVVASGTGLIYKWQFSTDGTNFNDLSNGGVYSNVGTATMVITGATAGINSYRYRVLITGTCGSVTSNAATLTVNTSPSIGMQPSASAICSGSNTTFGVVASGTGLIYKWQFSTDGTNFNDLSNGGVYSNVGTATMAITGATAGINNYQYRVLITGTCGSVTSNVAVLTVKPTPTAPLTSQVNVSCGGLGSITLSSLPTNNWKVYLNDQSGAHQYNRQNTETDLTINNLPVGTYNFTVEDVTSTCISSVASVEIIDITTNTTWNGSAWSNGAPDGSKSVTISSVLPNQPFPKPVPSSPISFTACSLTISATDGDVIIPSEMTLTVTNGITSNGKLVFESGSSLLQGSSAVNSGSISYKRKVDLTRYDVVYWGSPVTDANMTMAKFSPNTLWDKYHYWDAANGQWILNSFGTKVMKEGEGYSIRAPQNFSLTIPDTFEGIFVGEPNNGDLSVPVLENKLNLIGNPYPSPISAKELMLANKTQLGSLYFWSHNSPPQIIPGTNTFQYISSDFVVFNGTGSTRVNDDPATEFKGFIGAGQAFFTISPAGATAIKFNNDLRKASSQNTQFYKPSEASKTESNRLWLNIANSQGAFKQILIGYVEGATNGIDFSYDATTRGGTAYIDFYSISESRKLTIQGRALPFDDTDVVPLGYKSGVDDKGDRNFTISIDHADGFFATQAVYLEDKALGKIIDLRKENYTFFSLAGSNSTRFSIRYTNKTLGTDDFENLENTVLVSVKDKAVNITSSKETIKEVNVYNVGAQLLYSNNKVNASDLQIKNLHSSDQVLLVKIILENGHTFTKKVIFSNL
ncbi:T9SS sorting signal type C domain-containing protein [Flavobacterium luteolum]|uniref:T9SS sorting signal type C domain-containing protein n=1 Tax=Flavobacterium luteolum TaxID=3003259 RepID=UPI00248E2819|nr:T9SS sorting signal type C domain-containing protein [Flavobacterium luteolum]